MADGFVPPQAVRNNARRGLELRKKHGRGGTEVGVARARDLSNGAALSLDTIKRMNSYFARHEVDKKGEGWGVDSAGYIAWLLWGGDAGRSWARGITNREEAKEKATMNDLTTAYFEIIKADKRDDGTLMVYGKATDDSLDIDQQICDPIWLDRAMPEWFKSGGNIREQHSSIAAGVAKEYEKKADGHYIHALVVDPISVKKVDNGVLKGFSIGIKSPRVVRDQKAANGRIIDGQIVEVSLVDRPANPNCQLVLAKSVEGESGMWKTEELIMKKEENYGAINSGGEGSEPSDKDLYARVKAEAKEKFEVYPSAVANAWITREYKKRGGGYKKTEKSADTIEKEQPREANGQFGSSTRSDSDSNGGGKDDDDMDAQEGKGRNNGQVEAIDDDLVDAQNEIEEALDDLDNSDNEDDDDLYSEKDKALSDASSRVSAAQAALDDATRPGSFNEHVELMEEAQSNLQQAVADLSRRGIAGDLAGVRETVQSSLNDVKNYLSGLDKSAIGDLNKAPSLALQLSAIEDLAEKRELLMKNAQELIELSKSIVPADIVKFDQKLYDDARRALAQLIVVEANEMDAGSNEEMSIAHLLTAVHHLLEWYEGEVAEGEVMDPVTEDIEMAAKPKEDAEKKELKPAKGESKLDFLKRAKEAGMKRAEARSMYDKYMSEEADMEKKVGADCDCEGCKECKAAGGCDKAPCADCKMVKSADVGKCLECGCHDPAKTHGRDDVSTAVIVTPDKTPKSAEPTEEVRELEDQELPVAEEAPTEEEEKVSEGSDLSEEIEAIVEKAIKSATESLKSEIANLANANKAAAEKAVGLESELAVTKSLAVAGGPKRTIKPIDHSTNDLLVKAATYKAKADATTDPDLMKGYKLLSQKYFAEAETLNKSN
jgi:hypothetical protein